MALIDSLNTIRDSLNIDADIANIPFGTPLTARIIPDITGLTVREIVNQALDLTLIGKGVVFANAVAGDATVLRPLPLIDLTTVPPSVVNPGVPGILGGITGNLPIPLEIPIRVIVEWSVHRGDDTPLMPGTDYIAPAGLNNIDVSILFIPLTIEELINGAVIPADTKMTLRATVIVRTGSTATASRQIDVAIVIGGLLLPKVLACFRDANFGGAALVVVPSDSQLGSVGAIVNIFNSLQALFRPFENLVRFAAFVSGLRLLSQVLSTQPHIQFRSAERIDNLNDITLIQRSWYQNDTEAEDELSSGALIAPNGHAVEFFKSRNCSAGAGKFTLTTGNMLHAAVRYLNGKSPGSDPLGNEIVVNTAPSDRFNNELSSLRFS